MFGAVFLLVFRTNFIGNVEMGSFSFLCFLFLFEKTNIVFVLSFLNLCMLGFCIYGENIYGKLTINISFPFFFTFVFYLSSSTVPL